MTGHAIRRFLRRQDGALIPFAIQIFLMMMICLGITIDLVRQEELRTRVQNTLDRAALASASLSQELPPAEVVQDYLKKAGLGYLKVTPIVEEGELKQWRRVSITASEGLTTIFGPLIGMNSLRVNASSQAEESIGNVEISLALDISGSMDYNINTNSVSGPPTRMDQLRPAALNFVRKMFETVQPEGAAYGRLSISIVPYNQQVVLGSELAAALHLSTDHTQNTCADVEALSDTDIAINADLALQRTMYGDSFNYWGYRTSSTGPVLNVTLPTYATQIDGNGVKGIENCIETAHANVLAFSGDQTTIETRINGLTPGGDTAIDVGARWGFALLDPAMRPALTRMIATDPTRSDLAGRPLDYGDGDGDISRSSMKVLVLMTDGENTRSYSTKPTYRTGASGFYSTSGTTSFGPSGTGWSSLYYMIDDNRAKPYYKMSNKTWYAKSSITGTLSSIDWKTIWGKGYTLQYVINTFVYPPKAAATTGVSKTGIYSDMAIQSEFSQKDTALHNLCATAKAASRGIYVFTVAVNAPEDGVNILRDCATEDGYAYNVTASGLTDAFTSIAAAISALRLTN
ncbi:MAG TPA: pilus assembly protein TadG-related protein [Paenirhodobacter sp.]